MSLRESAMLPVVCPLLAPPLAEQLVELEYLTSPRASHRVFFHHFPSTSQTATVTP